MAVVPSTLTQLERDLAAADKPILAATPDADNFLDASSGWEVGTITGTVAGATDTATTKPIRRAVDGLPGLRTEPDAANALHTLVLVFASPGIEFDFVGFLGHNFDTVDVTDMTIEVADDATFATNLRTLSNLTPTTLGSDRRFADLTLIDTGIDAQRFSGVEFIRFGLTLGGAGVPSIGQVVLGRRRQLKFEPNRPWDNKDLHSDTDRFESRSGVITDIPRFRGRRRIVANLNPFVEPFQQDIIDWYADTNQGVSPFVWIDTPNTTPNDFYFCKMDQPSLEYPNVLFSTRDFTLRGFEQGPNFFSQDPS